MFTIIHEMEYLRNTCDIRLSNLVNRIENSFANEISFVRQETSYIRSFLEMKAVYFFHLFLNQLPVQGILYSAVILLQLHLLRPGFLLKRNNSEPADQPDSIQYKNEFVIKKIDIKKVYDYLIIIGQFTFCDTVPPTLA